MSERKPLPGKSRRLKLQMQMSLDGMVSTGPNHDQRWVVWALEEIYEDVLTLLDSSDTILIGRKLAVDYIPYWQDTLKRPDDPMFALAERIVGAKKVVFSKTLDNSKWDNTVIARGELSDEVNRLKQQEGKDLIVYGGSSFVSALIKEKPDRRLPLFSQPGGVGEGRFGLSDIGSLPKTQTQKVDCLWIGNSPAELFVRIADRLFFANMRLDAGGFWDA